MAMKKTIALVALSFLVILNGCCHHVECQRHRDRDQQQQKLLFVFGDAFVDAGNMAERSGKNRMTRGWYEPYGSSRGNPPTGRLSDGLVQSDYLAKMLGMGDVSPPAYSRRGQRPGGVNFAMPFSGVLNGQQQQQEQLSLREQISQFAQLDFDDSQLEDSVALVSIANGHDYSHVGDSTSSGQLNAYIGDVTDGIVQGVKRLQSLRVSKIMVNSMPPLGCMPYRSRLQGGNYAQCDTAANALAAAHNALHRQKLDALEDEVLVLDLYSTFSSAAQSMSGSTPCCDTSDRTAYCGQQDGNGRAQFSVCANPGSYLYWDYDNPTQAGWEAVMDRLQGNIQDFLGIY